MENSVFSSSSAPCSKPNTPHSPEESSWTMYFQEFNDNDEHTSFSSSPYEKTDHTLASHASSLAPQELSNYHDNRKKPWRNLIGVAVDDELEDTASSPVNSPKVSHINHQGKGNFSVSKGKGGDSGQNEMDARGRDDGEPTDESDLKKKGLCLVPMSMITKYIG
nr:Lysine-specific demethylase [Ipomoea batatas]